MDGRKQLLILLAVVALVLGAILVVLLAGGGGQSRGDAPRFLAATGRTRDGAQPVVSRREDTVKPGLGERAASMMRRIWSPGDRTLEETPPEAPVPPAFSPEPLSPAEALAREAVQAVDPAKAIARLEAGLSGLDSLAEASLIYSALGAVHARAEGADSESAREAFREAAALARTPAEVHFAAEQEAGALLQDGKAREAAEVAEAALDLQLAATAPGMRLGIVAGAALEQLGMDDEAAARFEGVLRQAEAAAASCPEALEIYRQASLRLARAYRKTGRDAQARDLARQVRQRFTD